MKNKIIDSLKYINRFGIYRGLILILKIKIGALENIHIPGIKHRISLRPGTSDLAVFNQIFFMRDYDFRTGIEPKIIIDGGANIGLSAIYFKNRFPDATLIAVEPDKNNFALLKKNTFCYPDIHLKLSGLWNKKITANVTNKYNMGEWAMALEEVSPGTGDVISTTTMDELIDEFNIQKIDLLKLDIETAEKELFKDNYLNWLPKVKMIVIELHDRLEKGCSKSFFNAINSTFKNYSFDLIGENVIIINEDI